ncbi:MAG: hypothetical protein AB7K68_10975 [Bacteriovoracia bacterium]
MMTPSKVGRPAKSQLKCFACKSPCLPKNGDWFVSLKSTDQQVFLCRDCERGSAKDYKRAMPFR